MKKILFPILVAILMMFAMMPMTAGTVHAEDYNLWVGGTQVTSDNLSGEGWSYDPEECTLTLEHAVIEDEHIYSAGKGASIYYYCSENNNLTIEVKGEDNSVGTYEVYKGIYVGNGSLTIKGSGTLNVKGKVGSIFTDKNFIVPEETSAKVVAEASRELEDEGVIHVRENIEISGGTVNASATGGDAIVAGGKMTVSGGTVTAVMNGIPLGTAIKVADRISISGGTVAAKVSSDDCNAISAGSEVSISGGTITADASGYESFGISSGYRVYIDFGRNPGELTSTGTGAAFNGNAICYCSATGWADVEGAGEGTDFADGYIDGVPSNLSGYKKVRLPLVKHTVSFKVVNGLWDDGTAAEKKVTLRGYGTEVLKLADSDIPAVGSKPADEYEAGSWDVTPSTETAITRKTTYSYTYAQKLYPLTVNNGTGGDSYAAGAAVTITADAPAEGKRFKEWTGDVDKVTFTEGSKKTATAKFTMPAEPLTFEATYEDIPAKATPPTGKTLTYTGQSQTGVEAGTGYTLSGTTNAVDAGSYQATATLEEGYEWDDGTDDPKTINWTIEKATAKVTAPTGKTYTYNGKPRTGVASGTEYTLSGTVSATKAGNYKAKATLNANANYTYQWTDGTTAAKTIKWKINKAANAFKIKARTATVKYAKVKKKTQKLGVTKVIKFTNKGQGTKTYIKKSGNAKITIAKTTGKVTVKKGLKKGTYKVKVKVKAAGNANYNASAWKTVTFKITVK